MGLQYLENLLRRYRGQRVTIKTCSGGLYDGAITEITNDYVALNVKRADEEVTDQVFVLLHSIESMTPTTITG